jgi:hypothetical protein
VSAGVQQLAAAPGALPVTQRHADSTPHCDSRICFEFIEVHGIRVMHDQQALTDDIQRNDAVFTDGRIHGDEGSASEGKAGA